MVDFCAVVGDGFDADAMRDRLLWTGRERVDRYETADITVLDARRPDDEGGPASARTGDGHLDLWLWGTVYGTDAGRAYTSRPATERSAAFVADRYAAEGSDALAGLNGDFCALAHDRRDGTVSLVTDRLGTHDLYYATDGDALVVSSSIQALARYPGVTPEFAPEYLQQFCVYTRAMGVRTPLVGVTMVPPATVLTHDIATGTLDAERYWRPTYRPLDRGRDFFVRAFRRRFAAALRDRLPADGQVGVFLSGGSDSRLVLAAMDDADRDRTTAYHLANWRSREARTADRVARTAGVDFELLERDADYLRRLLQRTPGLSNFAGRFDQAYAEGFMDRVASEVDVVVDATYADILFKGWGLPRRRLSLPLGTVTLPLAGPSASVDDYIAQWARPSPPYLVRPRPVEATLRDEISQGADVVHHGVHYPSPTELFVWSHVHPQTNMGGSFVFRSLRQHLPHRNPLFDTRLLDLSLSMPLRHHLSGAVVDAGVSAFDPALGAIPHAERGVPPASGFPRSAVAEPLVALWRKLTDADATPRPDLGHGPWEPPAAVLRHRPFFRETLEAKRPLVERLPDLSWRGAEACFEAHLAGEDHAQELFTLLTLLYTPVAADVADAVE